jgi:hypothetical protein
MVPVSAELGVDVDSKVIDLFEGGNFDPEFLKIVSRDFGFCCIPSHQALFIRTPLAPCPPFLMTENSTEAPPL